MNREARASGESDWTSYGAVTIERAASLHAARTKSESIAVRDGVDVYQLDVRYRPAVWKVEFEVR